jgi:GH15 family glucan-1,4-alpha-glucosidase
VHRQPSRNDGYAPIADYAALGDGHTAALVALDGAIDWLPLPEFDGPAAFGALIDARRGGSFVLRPAVPYSVKRRYVPDTNVVETTFRTDGGSVRLTDAMAVRDGGPTVASRVLRRVDGLLGEVPMRWRMDPRFGWGTGPSERTRHDEAVVLRRGSLALVLQTWDAGDLEIGDDEVRGEWTAREGASALISLAAFDGTPLVFERRDELEEHLGETADYWRRVAGRCRYDGPHKQAVVRSALALKLLIHEPSGAITAAPTTSLPEAIGGRRNYDYRYCWIRDSCFTLEAMLELGYTEQVHASLSWLLEASRRTHPRLSVFYHLDGSPPTGPEALDLEGYRGSRPVLDGNAAAGQLQLGNYGDLMEMAWMYVEEGHSIDPEAGRRLGEVADFATAVWRNADSSIWELPTERDYTQGKLSSWLALDRAVRLAEAGEIPADHAADWRRVAVEIQAFIDERCWSERRRAFTFTADSDHLDASILLAARVGYLDGSDPRLASTVDALRAELGRGPLLYRYSGMQDREGAFLACSFWLVEALCKLGRVDEAADTLDELVALTNDVGLLSEEIDPATGEFLGNFPQALSHLSLVNAVAAVASAERRGPLFVDEHRGVATEVRGQ